MNNSKILRYALAIAGALAVAFAAIAVTASAAGVNFNLAGASKMATKTATPATTHSKGSGKAEIAAYCGVFMNNFASDLKLPQAAVDAAAKKAFGQTVDQAVTDGKLTPTEAAKIKAAIPTGPLCSAAAGLHGFGPGGHGAGRLGARELGPYLGAYLDAAAKAAGLTGGAAELRTDMAAGQSLSAVAKAHGVDETTFRKNLIANLTPTLDTAVSAGKITAAQEKMILARLRTGPIPFWNGRPAGSGGTPPSGASVAPAA